MSRRMPDSAPIARTPVDDLLPVGPRLAVPAYFGPWQKDDWTAVRRDRPAVVVINPANGPGTAPTAAYKRLTKSLQLGGTAVLMYVHTGYLTRPRHEMVLDAERAAAWFAVDGVFFDEVAAEDSRPVRSSLDFLAGLSPGVCVFNAGREVPQRWFQRWPHASFVTFEGSAGQFVQRFGTGPCPQVTGPADRQWWLVHSLAPRYHARYWRLLEQAGVGYGYLTNDRLPNPWDVYVPPRRG